MVEFPPTPEQQTAIDAARAGDSMALEALAGTGKTTTLEMVANALSGRGQYTAFNRAIVDEAKARFPSTVRCSTAHGMAMGVTGKMFRHRLNGKRVQSHQIARFLGCKPCVVTSTIGQTRTLPAALIAGMAIRAVKRYCFSADEDLAAVHVPNLEGLDRDQNRMLSEFVLPYAEQAWADFCDPTGHLRFEHDYYLKMYQLGRHPILADFILFDECQLPTARVALPKGGSKALGDIEIGDRVVSWTKGRGLARDYGSPVQGKTIRPFSGALVSVQVGDHVSHYTPNHICMAKIGPAFENRFAVYLMRKDTRWRIGVTKGRHGTGPGRTTGPMGRLREEGGEALWVLGIYDTRAEAEAVEAEMSLKWRVPQNRFGQDKFWARWDTRLSDPRSLAEEFGRDLRYPLIGAERRYMLGDRFTEIRASNLADGMEMMTLDGGLFPCSVWSTPYDGPVVSLDVGGPKTYVADGIVTHNCQDANPVMLAIVEQQNHAQRVWVGDRFQQIYSWRGAVNAMEQVDVAQRAWLTQSWRFGPEIAALAARPLRWLGADKTIVGNGPAGAVMPLTDPDVVLCRTNAECVRGALTRLSVGQRSAIVGGAREMIEFARAARQLQNGEPVTHPELACFVTWGEVVAYVREDQLGGELAASVKLVEDFGPDQIMRLETVPEEYADVVFSTAHKAKGREWDDVQLAGDFPEVERLVERIGEGGGLEELRLLYVAVTRAKKRIDISRVPVLEMDELPTASNRKSLPESHLGPALEDLR